MSESVAPVVAEPTKIPPPIAAGSQGAGALAEGEPKKVAPESGVEDPFEFELDVKGQKQKIKFANKDQLKAVLQKATYADQTIKDATQAKKGAEALMAKIKAIGQGDVGAFRELMSDPDIGGDTKKVALAIVQEMMEDERLTPEQKRLRELEKYQQATEAEKKAKADAEKQAEEQRKRQEQATQIRGEIITAMKKYPDIPQTQATMDGVIQNMRAAYRKYGKHLTAEQAMTVYSEQYWTSNNGILEKMSPEEIVKRIPAKVLDKLQQMRLAELKKKTDPAVQKPGASAQKKKHLTEKEFEHHFRELAGGL